jgi:glucose-6-phosphate 1-dehydrogenase
MLPDVFTIVGFARSKMTDDQWREEMLEKLTRRYIPGGSECEEKMETFLSRCHYHAGNYNSIGDFSALNTRIEQLGGADRNCVFYMAIPPSIFIETAYSMNGAGLISDQTDGAWSLIVNFKPPEIILRQMYSHDHFLTIPE